MDCFLSNLECRLYLASWSSLVSCTVGGNGNVGQAGLALGTLLILCALSLAVSKSFDLGSCHGRLVGWSGLDQLHGLLEGILLSLTVGFTSLEVLGDEVTSRLDLEQVSLNGLLVFGGLLQVLLCLQEFLLLGCKVVLVFCQRLLSLSLLLLERCHAVLVICLSLLLISMGLHLLLVGLAENELQHLDDITSLVTLTLHIEC